MTIQGDRATYGTRTNERLLQWKRTGISEREATPRRYDINTITDTQPETEAHMRY